MAAGSTYEPIATTTLGSAQATVTFSSIPQGYTDLVLVTSFTSGNNEEMLRFNGDSGSNYSWTRLWGDGSTANSSRISNTTFIRNTGGDLTTRQNTIIYIQNYSNSTTNKTTLSRGTNPSVLTMAVVGLWRNTASITSMTYSASANNFATGSTFTLYGIAAA
jgi:hypothetical protein